MFKRLKSKTPAYFKKVGSIGVGLVMFAGILSAPNLGIPVIVPAVVGAIGATVKLISQLVVEDTTDLEKP